jgi:hypothetical protein
LKFKRYYEKRTLTCPGSRLAASHYSKILTSSPPFNKWLRFPGKAGCSFSNHTCWIIGPGGKIIAKNIPCDARTYIAGKSVMSTHAEMAALHNAGFSDMFGLLPNIYKYGSPVQPGNGRKSCKIPEDLRTKIISLIGTKRYRKMNRHTAMVVRTQWANDEEYQLMMSKPCLHCALLFAVTGIETIVYSDVDGNLIKSNIYEEEFTPSIGMHSFCRITCPKRSI